MVNCPIAGLLENGNFTNTSAYFLGSMELLTSRAGLPQ